MAILDIANVSRRFGLHTALRNVSMSVHAGQVHGLVGESGAGKSTLIGLLAGLDRPDDGAFFVDGAPVGIGAPWQVRAAGMRFIHQDQMPVHGLSVAESMFLGNRYPKIVGLVDWFKLNRMAKAALASLGLSRLDPQGAMADLPPGDQMLVRIAAMLIHGPDETKPWLYALDEPTAALTSIESDQLFEVIKRLVHQGASVLYASRRLADVLAFGDTVTVLRDGEHISTQLRRHTSRDRLIGEMTGRGPSTGLSERVALPARPAGAKARLEVDGLSAGPLKDVSFELYAGEVLGIAGLAGSGRNALLRALLGDVRLVRGTILLEGRALRGGVGKAWKRGVAYVPRERHAQGLVPHQSVAEAVVLPHLSSLFLGGVLRMPFKQRRIALAEAERVGVKGTALKMPCHKLSIGAQQKLLFARALAGRPKVLLLDEPTRAVDADTRTDLYRLIGELRAEGVAIILTSSDLPELLGLSDRLLLLHKGQVSATLQSQGMREAQLLCHFDDAAQKEAA